MVAKRSTPKSGERRRPPEWDRALTDKQGRLFAFIRDYWRVQGRAPATAEVAAALPDLGKDAVRYNLGVLAGADYLLRQAAAGTTRWSPTGPRALHEAGLWRLVDQGLADWSGGKPKGASREIRLSGEGYVSDHVLEDRE